MRRVGTGGDGRDLNSNTKKVFSEVVSVEAWHATFDKDGRAKVHVDLSFFEGLLGAENESAITFRVSLRRAVLKLVVPPNEPLAVLQAPVDREPTLEGIRKIMSESQSGLQSAGKISAKLTGDSLGVAASGEAKISKATATRTHTETTQGVSTFGIRQFTDANGCYCWEISPEMSDIMRGKVWDPVKQPRLTVKQTSSVKLPPVLEAHVLCRRGDIKIDKVEMKGKSALQNKFTRNRIAAAQAAIRDRILSLGLDHPDADNDLVEVKIAEALIFEEVA